MRNFYGQRVAYVQLVENPTSLVSGPMLPRVLPKALSECEIVDLIAAPDISTPAGSRGKAMIELMYAFRRCRWIAD